MFHSMIIFFSSLESKEPCATCLIRSMHKRENNWQIGAQTVRWTWTIKMEHNANEIIWKNYIRIPAAMTRHFAPPIFSQSLFSNFVTLHVCFFHPSEAFRPDKSIVYTLSNSDHFVFCYTCGRIIFFFVLLYFCNMWTSYFRFFSHPNLLNEEKSEKINVPVAISVSRGLWFTYSYTELLLGVSYQWNIQHVAPAGRSKFMRMSSLKKESEC